MKLSYYNLPLPHLLHLLGSLCAVTMLPPNAVGAASPMRDEPASVLMEASKTAIRAHLNAVDADIYRPGAIGSVDEVDTRDGRKLVGKLLDYGPLVVFCTNQRRYVFERQELSRIEPKRRPDEMAKPDLPDLDVTYIERTPRLRSNHDNVDYQAGQPVLREPNPDSLYPAAHSDVMFTAHVVNRGSRVSGACRYTWEFDGRTVGRGTLSNLEPNAEATIALKRKWVNGAHTISFKVQPAPDVPEISLRNNQLTDRTDALGFLILVTRESLAEFNRVPNMVDSFSFEDWVQQHFQVMNSLFAQSIYPDAPRGCLERMRVDRILYVNEAIKDQDLSAAQRDGHERGFYYEGTWQFGAWDQYAWRMARVDWGFLHEMGHKLGLTDLYNLDVAPETNQVLDQSGSPLLIGRSSVQGGMMHGHGPVGFSEEDVLALNHQLMRHRGYFGDFYYNIAAKNYLQITDANGVPVAGARLRLWQRGDHSPGFRGDPTITDTTDEAGRLLLPNRGSTFATAGEAGSGYQHRPNPFGLINVVGDNGVFLVEVNARGQIDYGWIEITQFNVANERQKLDESARHRPLTDSAVVQVATQLPAADAPAAPPPPQIEQSGTRVTATLQTDRPWVLMRADPDNYEWKPAGQATTNEPIMTTLPGAGLYRYAAATRLNGVLSARSAAIGVAGMVEPWGLAVAPDGGAYIRDRAVGRTLWIRPDGSAAGFVGSVHWHFENSFDHATDAQGMLYVAQWAQGYNPSKTLIRKVDPRGQGLEHDHTDLSLNDWATAEPGHFKDPMGIWVSPQDGTIVVADTGNNRIQILDPKGNVKSLAAGFNKPYKALLEGTHLVVADTGNHRVVVLDADGDGWKETASIAGFDEPVYLCRALNDDIWVADRALGRIIAIHTATWKKAEWQFPAADQPPIEGLAGTAYDAGHGDMLYIDSKAKRLVRRHVLD